MEWWSDGVMALFFRCVLRVTSCESHTAEFCFQYLNPQPGTRNAKRFIFEETDYAQNLYAVI